MGGRRKKWKRMAELGMILTEADKIDSSWNLGREAARRPQCSMTTVTFLTLLRHYYITRMDILRPSWVYPVFTNHDLYIYLLEVPLLSRRCAICRIISCFRS